MPIERPAIRVTEIGEFIRHHSCQRRFKLEHNNRELARLLPFSERLFNPLDPVLQEMGRCRENEWEGSLIDVGFTRIPDSGHSPDGRVDTPWVEFASQLRHITTGQNVYGREISVSGDIGRFHIEGRVDFILLSWNSSNEPLLRVVECKASRKDRTYHRIQVALYKILISNLLDDMELSIGEHIIDSGEIECIVARIEEATNDIQPILETLPIDLDMEMSDINHLLSEDGPFSYIINEDIESLSFTLDHKCDGCVFNVNCFPECSRQRKLELLGIEPSSIRVLNQNTIQTIDELAELDLEADQATGIRNSVGFSENLQLLKEKALARPPVSG